MAWREKKSLKPSDVFTPGLIPLNANNVLVSRADSEESLENYFEAGQIPVVHGEYGVGKTTLVLGYFRDYPEDRKAQFTVSTKSTIEDLFRTILEAIGYQVTTQSTERDIRRNEVGATMVLRGTLAEEYGSEVVKELVVTSPTDAGLVTIIRKLEVLVIVDELHKANAQFKAALSDFIKASRLSQYTFPAFALIGTTMTARDLTVQDEGVGRFLKPLTVEPMTETEARQIVVDGFARLDIAVGEDLRELIVRTAAGAPTLVQELCLKSSRRVRKRNGDSLLQTDYDGAVREYLRENDQRLTQSYLVSIEHQGQKRYRKQILAAMSELKKDIASLEDIRVKVAEILHEDVPSTALSGPLKELKRGSDSILVDFHSTGRQAAQILTSFREPVMKSFVRFMREVEAQGLVPDSAT